MPLSFKAAQLCIRSRSCPRQFGANQVSRRRPSTSHVYLRLIEMLSWPTSCHHPIPHPVRCPLCATRLAHNSQLNRKVKMSLIASIYLNEFSLAECRVVINSPSCLSSPLRCCCCLLSPPRLPDPLTATTRAQTLPEPSVVISDGNNNNGTSWRSEQGQL